MTQVLGGRRDGSAVSTLAVLAEDPDFPAPTGQWQLTTGVCGAPFRPLWALHSRAEFLLASTCTHN